MTASENHGLRQTFRQQRRDLPRRQQNVAADRLAANLARLPAFQNSRRLALYLPNDGEIDPTHIMAIAEASHKQCYLPVLDPLKSNRLYFARHQLGNKLINNRFGIPEPDIKANSIAPAWTLDLILMPLVAFDGDGNRLGMGGGFYDRTLAFTRTRLCLRPQLFGLAHHFQQTGNIAAENWDIPLNAVVTDHGVIYPTTSTQKN